MEYTGISADALFLLAQNRFENSRDFYEAHKEEIKQVDKAEEKKVLSEEEGLLLDDDALEKVSGGMYVKQEDPLPLK